MFIETMTFYAYFFSCKDYTNKNFFKPNKSYFNFYKSVLR